MSQEAKNVYKKLINYQKLNFTGGNKVEYDFSNFSPLRELFRRIYYGEILIPSAEKQQDEFDDMIKILKAYNPRDSKLKKIKSNLLINAQSFYDGRQMIISAFKNKIFPLKDPANFPDYFSEKDISPKSSINSDSEDELSQQYDKLYEAIFNVDTKLDSSLIRKYFNKRSLLELFKYLRHSRIKTINSAKQALVDANLSNLKKDIRNMSDDEIKNKNLDLIAYFGDKNS